MNREYYRSLGKKILFDIKNKKSLYIFTNFDEKINFNEKTNFIKNEPIYILSNINESNIYIQFIKI